MSIAAVPSWSWRQERDEFSRLAWAFAISICLHLLVFGVYYTGNKLNVWHNLHWPAWLRPVKVLVEAVRPKPSPALRPPQEAPLMFVEVSPSQATAEPSENAKFYSDKNSKAANPESDKNTDVPKISGSQTEIVRTEDVPRQQFKPLQPVPPAPPAKDEQQEARAKPTLAPGDLTLAKADPNPRKDDGQAPLPRPRTVQEARARQPENRLVGQKMKQEGGVPHRQLIPSLDTKATPFGAYDYALIQAVEARWFGLLDQRDYAADSRGKVELHFILHYDGRVTDMAIAENTAGEVLGLICEKAVQDPSPFAPWPSDMRHEMGDSRKIQFTFFYQ